MERRNSAGEGVAVRTGYDQRLGMGRALPRKPDQDLDDDPAMMVQEQIARIKFLAGKTPIAGKGILDLGCGTGFNTAYLMSKLDANQVLGVDISQTAVEFARKTYPFGSFLEGDISSPILDCGRKMWDLILCCEVIEHVPAPLALLDTVHRHLDGAGVAFISTPNRPVFSLNYEPSPVNHTHIKEYTLTEFRDMLQAKFSKVEIWGQRFSNPQHFAMQQGIVLRNIADYRLLGEWYWKNSVRRIWKTLRLEPLRRLCGGGLRYGHRDFTFVNPVTQDSVWLCALVGK
ncbi:MAG: class I SAM-dependent methyltransferase [Nitrospira sp.]|nr:class I SAM-dependent methyltransferase [Nitrospira sp.]